MEQEPRVWQIPATESEALGPDAMLASSSPAPFTIQRIRLGVLELPLPRPFYFRRGAVDRRRYSVAEVSFGSDVVGSAYSLVRSVPAATIAEDIGRGLLRKTYQDPGDLVARDPAWQARTELSRWPIAQALALLELAVWDAYAKSIGKPIGALVSSGPLAAPPGIAVVGYRFDGPDTAIEEAAAAVDAGFDGVKLPIGDRPPDEDAAIIREIRRQHPDVRIHVDAHWNFDSVAEAVERVALFIDQDIVWVEDALPVQVDPRWIGAGFPEAIGDDVLDPLVLSRALARGLVVRPDVSNLGIVGWRSVVREASELGGLVTNHVHGKLHAPLLAGITALHPSGIERFYDEAAVDPIEPLIVGGARVERGKWVLPESAGFGFSFDPTMWDDLTTWSQDIR